MSNLLNYLKDKKILTLIIIFLVLLSLDVHYGLHFGIEFIGGSQINVRLEHSVNASTMSSLISLLNQRLSTFGLKQITVEGIGNSEVYVTLPTISKNEINQTINIIDSQGSFEGIVNGKQAVNGSSILRGSIGSFTQSASNTTQWTVSFFINDNAAKNFSKIVFGQANQPLYMFLDRPSSAILLINSSILSNTTLGLSATQSLQIMRKTLFLGNNTIQVVPVSNSNQSIKDAENIIEKGSYKTIILSSNLNQSLINYLSSKNYTLNLESIQNMTPQYASININQTIINTWPAVGLLSAPLLNPSITNGSISDSYEISGSAPVSIPKSQQATYAQQQAKTISSILTGGALPVPIFYESQQTVPPTLGKHFLFYSIIALIVAVLLISVFIVIRYVKPFLIIPILLITLLELFIIVSVIGLIGTIDLSAIAGMIAVVGTGVDAQIIITDELLAKGSEKQHMHIILGNAFYIVYSDAILLIIAMLPLFFSTSLVTMIGFSESAILGAILGVLITRPAYSAILSRHFG
ncbi:MAG: hypothetical protein M1168_00325 [Candidatus Marsarchaeota archaeon]|nr:hypothetical protein [Candidatus Marsarchaeota archaeon]MCL5094417.1 hypothetical protein [Candidatus Marsarchaeota archaeon]